MSQQQQQRLLPDSDTIRNNTNDNHNNDEYDNDDSSIEYIGTRYVTTNTSTVTTTTSSTTTTTTSGSIDAQMHRSCCCCCDSSSRNNNSIIVVPTSTTTTTTTGSSSSNNSNSSNNNSDTREADNMLLLQQQQQQQQLVPPSAVAAAVATIKDDTTTTNTNYDPNHKHYSRRYPPNEHKSLSTSIYVQNLAEICYTILYDRRWQCCCNSDYITTTNHHHHSSVSSVFHSLYGDDCTVIEQLSQLYYIPTSSSQTTTTTTTQISSSRESSGFYDVVVDDGLTPQKLDTRPVVTKSSLTTTMTKTTSDFDDHNDTIEVSIDKDSKAVKDLINSPSPPSTTSLSDQNHMEYHYNNNSIQNPKNDLQHHKTTTNGVCNTISSSSSSSSNKYYLYCRLHYRKGPWFRIDDIYTKYYSPMCRNYNYYNHQTNTTYNTMGTNSPNPTDHVSDNDNSNTIHKSHISILQIQQQESIRMMIQDIVELLLIGGGCGTSNNDHLGIIRYFDNESECGQIIGNTTTTFLTMDEQRTILSKIGGTTTKNIKMINNNHTIKSKKHTSTSSYNCNNNNNKRQKLQPTNDGTYAATTAKINMKPNLIWQQMRQQTSIITSFMKVNNNNNNKKIHGGSCTANFNTSNTKKNNHPNVLPVQKHLETLLINKLVQIILQEQNNYKSNMDGNCNNMINSTSATATANITTTSARISLDNNNNNDSTKFTSAPEVYSFITQCIHDQFKKTATSVTFDTSNHNHHVGCFRLCERPYSVLQRCVRLYLCATLGPGNMRSTPNNGYRTILTSKMQCLPTITTIKSSNSNSNTKTSPTTVTVDPPSVWHHVSYPSMMYCFGQISMPYQKAYIPLPIAKDNTTSMITNDIWNTKDNKKDMTCDSNDRPSSDDVHSFQFPPEQVFPTIVNFHRWEMYVELRCYVDYLLELNELYRSEERRRIQRQQKQQSSEKPIDPQPQTMPLRNSDNFNVDCMSLLLVNGRLELTRHFVQDKYITSLMQYIECDVHEINNLIGVYEQILGIIGIIFIHVMNHVYLNNEEVQIAILRKRPWLRHMSWMAGLALIVFDIIPILERRGLYYLTVRSLQLLIYGSLPISSTFDISLHIEEQLVHQQRYCEFAPWISRRGRGKLLERLIVDCSQIYRRKSSSSAVGLKRTSVKAKKMSSDSFRNALDKFCREIIAKSSLSSSIGFSVIRTIARRLKQPLNITLNPIGCIEANELGIRLCNADDSGLHKSRATTYSDWTPITDYFVANSILRDTPDPGGRCLFVGFEDDMDHSMLSSSLNVEELALDLYRTGRLPACDDDQYIPRGGWVGWHNEGGMVRSLFRIICGTSILRMDFGHGDSVNNEAQRLENSTIHLSPYQQGPFHLLVGYELEKLAGSDAISDEILYMPSPNFYCRSADSISKFLTYLSTRNGQELADIVYNAVAARLKYACMNHIKDPHVELDVFQVRTMSALAAGFGGMCLAAMFRCFIFDYRHYSGGLPDLHLLRATKRCANLPGKSLVDLGDLIGESFSKDNQQSAEFLHALNAVVDDEFIGLDKPINPRGGLTESTRDVVNKSRIRSLSLDMLPKRLELTHYGSPVEVECLLVEVKSSNDRLDPRQEDWLNVIDKFGKARVCKFVDSKKGAQNEEIISPPE